MNKSVLSVVVTGLLVPMVQAMDGGPPVEVELPEVAVPHVEVELPTVEVDLPAVVDVPEVEVEVPAVETPEVEFVDCPIVCTLPVDIDVPVIRCEIPEPPFCRDFYRERPLPIVENGNPVECFPPGFQFTRLNENGLFLCEFVDPDRVNENGAPEVFYSFSSAAGGDDPAFAYRNLSSSNEVPNDASESRSEDGTAIRNLMSNGFLPNFRGGVSEREPELPATRSQGDAHAADPQLVNAGQRGTERSAERSLRADGESTAPRTGLGRFIAKFHRSESEVIPASAITTDTALSSQLAGIDRLRDTALRTGDQKLLAKADKLEQELRARSGNATKIPTRTK